MAPSSRNDQSTGRKLCHVAVILLKVHIICGVGSKLIIRKTPRCSLCHSSNFSSRQLQVMKILVSVGRTLHSRTHFEAPTANVLKNALHPVRATSGHPSRHQLEENHTKTENVLSHFRPQKSLGLPNIQPISTKIYATTLQISFLYCSRLSSFCTRKFLINMLGDLFLSQPVPTKHILVSNVRLSIELFEQQGLR